MSTYRVICIYMLFAHGGNKKVHCVFILYDFPTKLLHNVVFFPKNQNGLKIRVTVSVTQLRVFFNKVTNKVIQREKVNFVIYALQSALISVPFCSIHIYAPQPLSLQCHIKELSIFTFKIRYLG